MQSSQAHTLPDSKSDALTEMVLPQSHLQSHIQSAAFISFPFLNVFFLFFIAKSPGHFVSLYC